MSECEFPVRVEPQEQKAMLHILGILGVFNETTQDRIMQYVKGRLEEDDREKLAKEGADA